MRWQRLTKWAKWGCTGAAGAAVALSVFSGFYGWAYTTRSNAGNTVWITHISEGQVLVTRAVGIVSYSSLPPSGWELWRTHHWYWGTSEEKNQFGVILGWRAGLMYMKGPPIWVVGASVLYPVAMTLIPAALLWYADRRRFGPGRCAKCGYDRAGLSQDVKCPECGTVPTPASK